MDTTGNFTPTQDFLFYDFSSFEWTGSAEFLNSLKPLKPAPKKSSFWGGLWDKTGGKVVDGAKASYNFLKRRHRPLLMVQLALVKDHGT